MSCTSYNSLNRTQVVKPMNNAQSKAGNVNPRRVSTSKSTGTISTSSNASHISNASASKLSTKSRLSSSPDVPRVQDAFWQDQGLWLPFRKVVEDYFPRYFTGDFKTKDGKRLTFWQPKDGRRAAVADCGWTWDSMTRLRGIFYNPITHAVRYIPWQHDPLWGQYVPFEDIKHDFVAYHLRFPDTQLLEVYVRKADGMVVVDYYKEPNRKLPLWKLDRVWYHYGDNSAT